MNSNEYSEIENDIKIANTYIMKKNSKIGSGAFGEIYKGKNLNTGEEVAIKFESSKSKTPQLNYESKILKLLQGGGKFNEFIY
jgi:predicted Ser/Thr protein kinase